MTDADQLVATAADIAYLVRTAPRAQVEQLVTYDIRAEDKNALIVVLAALIDIDRTKRQLVDALHQAPIVVDAINNLQRAQLASYRPCWEAHYLYNDGDPIVKARAREYQKHINSSQQGAA